MQAWIEWVRLHPVETMAVIFALGRLALKYIPADTPNAILQAIREVAKIVTAVAPPDVPAIEKAVGKTVDAKVDAKVERAVDLKVAEVASAASGGGDRGGEVRWGLAGGDMAGESFGAQPLRHDRPMLRRRFRRIASRNGLDISELGDDDIEEAINRAQAEADRTVGGPVMDFLTWVMDHQDVILGILKLILSFVGEDRNAKAGKAGAS